MTPQTPAPQTHTTADTTARTSPTPTSGRRRAATAPAPAGFSRARAAALVVAAAGILLVLAGGLRATVYAPSPTSVATLSGAGQPVVTTAVGLLGLDGPRAEVVARDSARRPVFVGIGRAADVDAYLAGVSRAEVTGQDGNGGLVAKKEGSDRSLPDPAGADVWVVSQRGTGQAALVWPDAPGQWRVVVATDGSAPAPDSVAVTWSGRDVSTGAPALIAIGLVLVVAGLITAAMLRSRSRVARPGPPARDRGPHTPDPAPAPSSAPSSAPSLSSAPSPSSAPAPARSGPPPEGSPPTRPVPIRPEQIRPEQIRPEPARPEPASADQPRPGRLDELARPHGFERSDRLNRPGTTGSPEWPGTSAPGRPDPPRGDA